MQETQVHSLDQEDPLEKEMATHFSTLAWKIPWTEEPGRLQSMGSQRIGHNRVTSLSLCYNIANFPHLGKENQWYMSWSPPGHIDHLKFQ